MKLTEIFTEAICHAEQLVDLHSKLTTSNERGIRADWKENFYGAKLTDWPQKDGLWRSRNSSLLIVGTSKAKLTHQSFTSEALAVFLRAGLVMVMSAIDKVLHEAVAKDFVSLVKRERLDDLVDLALSKSYRIAIESRKKKGVGGKIRIRPGSKIKKEVLDSLYRESFLSLHRLQQICAACGAEKIFDRYGRTLKPRRSSSSLQERWRRLYIRRNQIAHECDIVRKSKTRKVSFHRVTATELKESIDFVKAFGNFLSQELE